MGWGACSDRGVWGLGRPGPVHTALQGRTDRRYRQAVQTGGTRGWLGNGLYCSAFHTCCCCCQCPLFPGTQKCCCSPVFPLPPSKDTHSLCCSSSNGLYCSAVHTCCCCCLSGRSSTGHSRGLSVHGMPLCTCLTRSAHSCRTAWKMRRKAAGTFQMHQQSARDP
jgi:hypothetical protein